MCPIHKTMLDIFKPRKFIVRLKNQCPGVLIQSKTWSPPLTKVSFFRRRQTFDIVPRVLMKLPHYRPRSEGDNVLGSVRPSVCPSVRPSVRLSVCMSELSCLNRFISPRCLSVCRPIARRSHYQSKMFVCVSTNRADAVDRLLFK